MVTEVARVPCGEALVIDVDEGGRGQLALGAVRDESLVPLLGVRKRIWQEEDNKESPG